VTVRWADRGSGLSGEPEGWAAASPVLCQVSATCEGCCGPGRSQPGVGRHLIAFRRNVQASTTRAIVQFGHEK
jgi:hypothetical protein